MSSYKFKKNFKKNIKIQKLAKHLTSENYSKELEKYEEEINLQDKISEVIEDQIFNIQAIREKIRAASDEPVKREEKKETIKFDDQSSCSSFNSDTEFNRELVESVPFYF